MVFVRMRVLVVCLGLALAAPRAVSAAQFWETFNSTWTLAESSSMSNSSSQNWWLNSGGRVHASGAKGGTIFGDLPAGDYWRLLYARTNPYDTDKGVHPQNLFRMVTRKRWTNLRQQVYFDVKRTILSSSSNRNASNGVLLFNRYQDGQNLYYAGIRVDGTVVIKKKIRGVYYTMAQTRVISGTYSRSTRPNLIPLNRWLGLKSRVYDGADGGVHVEVSLDWLDGRGFRTVLSAVDTGRSWGAAIRNAGYGGIRTDFMDVAFDDFVIADLW